MNGVPDMIEPIVAAFLEMSDADIEKAFADKRFVGENEKVFNYKNNINFKKLGIPTFFKKFDLTLAIKKSPGKKKPYYSGDYFKVPSIKKKMFGGWVSSPVIKLSVSAKNPSVTKKIFAATLTHELTHAYNDFCYVREKNKSIKTSPFMANIVRINRAQKEGPKKATTWVFYHLDIQERNAYIAQLQQELLQKKIQNRRGLYEALEATESFKHYKWLKRDVLRIINEIDPSVQEEILEEVKKITGKQFSHYNQFRNYMWGRFKKWEKAFLTKSHKIAYNVYEKINNS